MLTVIRPNILPRFWWLNPWSTVSYLHEAVTALKGYADRLDSCINLQHQIIDDQSAEVARLKSENDMLHQAIIAGRAIVPDAQPHE
jgi:hypothetical protein